MTETGTTGHDAGRKPRPSVSVVMPVYNAGRYLTEAIDSVLAQTFSDWELIAVDDESSDSSVTILSRYADSDARISVISRPHTGIVGARNDGIAAARGEFVAFLDNDDLMLPDRLTSQAEFLRTNPEFNAVGVAALMVDEDGDPLIDQRVVTTHEEIDAELLQGRNPIVQSGVMIRTESLRSVGGFREESCFAEDFDLFLRLGEIGRMANLDRVLMKQRQHIGRASYEHYTRQQEVAERALAQAYQRRQLKTTPPPIRQGWHPDTAAGYHIRCASDAWDGGHPDVVRKHARGLWRENPLSLRALELYTRTIIGRRAYSLVEHFKKLFRPFRRSTH